MSVGELESAATVMALRVTFNLYDFGTQRIPFKWSCKKKWALGMGAFLNSLESYKNVPKR